MAIPNVTPYSGQKPAPGQDQPTFNQNMSDELDYFNALPAELNAAIDAMNQTATDLEDAKAVAEAAKAAEAAAAAAANYQGSFVSGSTSATAGESYSFGGSTWLCLANTTTDPAVGNANWRKVVSFDDVKSAEERAIGTGVSIYRGSNGSYVQNGDAVPVGTTHLSVLINGKVEDLVAWDELTLPTVVTAVPTNDNGFSGYDLVTEQGTFELVTTEVNALRNNGSLIGYGCAGDATDNNGNKTDTATDDTSKILYAISKTGRNSMLDGGGRGYLVSSTLVFDAYKKIENIVFVMSNSMTLPAVWFGDAVNDEPTNYNGRNLSVKNVKIIPNHTATTICRFRGLQDCYFENFDIDDYDDQNTTTRTLARMDGVLGTVFNSCRIEGKDSVSTLLDMGLMWNLDDTASAGNGLGSTSTVFSNCKIRRGGTLGKILGDGISFDQYTILEFTNSGFEVTATGSEISFKDCYWGNIENWKIYARGVDSRNPSTKIVVDGGKVQFGTNNGSETDRAFFKLKHAHNATMKNVILQGASQTRLAQFDADSNGCTDSILNFEYNSACYPRKIATQTTAQANYVKGSDIITVESPSHGLNNGDIIDVLATSVVSIGFANLSITTVDADSFTYEVPAALNSTGSIEITYERYRNGSNNLADMDMPNQAVTVNSPGRVIGVDQYNFSDCTTEFVVFTIYLRARINGGLLLNFGANEYTSDKTCFIKSIKHINQNSIDATRYCTVYTGGKKYNAKAISSVDNESRFLSSTTRFIKPEKVEAGEPIYVKLWDKAGTYPKTVSVVLEIVKTNFVYPKDL